jgi:predicted ester cyclase
MAVDRSLSQADAAQMIQAARLFYAFWDTGNAAYASAVVDNDFRDNTVPEGRPQGPKGLLYASQTFRSAVPDLHCTIKDLLVSGDKVTARLLFNGTHKALQKKYLPSGVRLGENSSAVEFIGAPA